MAMRVLLWAAVLSGITVSGCATTGAPGRAASAGCVADSLDSPPGRAWAAAQRWRYSSDEAAAAAYAALVQGRSPWPDWFVPVDSMLPAGTRLQMVLGGAQTPDQPGGFATFDNVREPQDVRDGLAVLQQWKPVVDRVVIYETTQPLPVRIGPIGPQVDSDTCRLLEGRWSQVQMMVPPAERMTYLRVVEVRGLP